MIFDGSYCTRQRSWTLADLKTVVGRAVGTEETKGDATGWDRRWPLGGAVAWYRRCAFSARLKGWFLAAFRVGSGVRGRFRRDCRWFEERNGSSKPEQHSISSVQDYSRDKLELKAVKDGSVCYTTLERKAELYEKLVKGELPDEEDQEKYCVDFFRKGTEKDELPQPPSPRDDVSQNVPLENEEAGDDGSVSFNFKPVRPGRTFGAVDSAEHTRNVRYRICILL
ncbi:hypothetical protein SESBI_03891 [Sesbania bispinosa]|nr:hypothetical protein SESBI_03891 [Sesbania bispinosa]